MDPKAKAKLTKLKEEMEKDASRENTDTNLLAETLDYHEHMEQRHKAAGRKVNQTIVAEKRQEIKGDIDPRMEQLLDDCAELIEKRRDAYYVAGQKMWLASESANHQTDPMTRL